MSDRKFDLSKYETVKERKQRFYKEFPDGRIIVEMMNGDILEQALFKATTYKSQEDQAKNLPMSTGYAHEIRDKELQKNQYGKTYESVNYTSWVENCEESAIGRALDNAGFSGNGSCSREEMQKVEKVLEKAQGQPTRIGIRPTDKMISAYKYYMAQLGRTIDQTFVDTVDGDTLSKTLTLLKSQFEKAKANKQTINDTRPNTPKITNDDIPL